MFLCDCNALWLLLILWDVSGFNALIAATIKLWCLLLVLWVHELLKYLLYPFIHYLVFSSLFYIPISFVCSIIWWKAALVFVGLRIATYFISSIAFASMLYNFAILRSKILKFGATKDLEIRYGKAILNFKYFIRIKG